MDGAEAPVNQPVDREVETVDLPELGVIRQEDLGPGEREGGGEWPDPHTPARGPSPGRSPARGAASGAAREQDR